MRAAKLALQRVDVTGRIQLEAKAATVAIVSPYGRLPVTNLRAAIVLWTLENAQRGAPRKLWDELTKVSGDDFPIYWMMDLDGKPVRPWIPGMALTLERMLSSLAVGDESYAIDYRDTPRVGPGPVPGDERAFNVKVKRVA
jgi:hypothetical protein